MPKSRPSKRPSQSASPSQEQSTPGVEDLMCELMGVAKGIKRFMEQRFAENNFPAALTGPRMGVLFHVNRNGGLRMGDLAERLGVAARTVTDLVDALERDGLLVRRPDPADGRATLLELTAVARADFERAHATSKSFLQQAFSPLSPDERREFIKLLMKLRAGPIGRVNSLQTSDPCRATDV